ILFTWGVLQAIGFAGLITLIFINLRNLARFIISLFLLILYQILSNISIYINGNQMVISDLILNDVHGGIIGGFGWAIMMLISTVIGELFENKRFVKILIIGVILTILGASFSVIWGISKHRVNISYIILSTGLASLLFCLLWWIFDEKALTHGKGFIFQPQGKNPFALYILHGLFYGFTILLIPKSINWALIIVTGFINMIIIWVIAFILDKKKIYITI
ncbi:MAG: hypothetical protein ACTSXY_05020, partial [Promethearchaeota archaeon]